MSRPSHITVCGHFGEGKKLADGQTVKTQVIVKALRDIYGDSMISICDTYQWKRYPFRMLRRCVTAAKKSSDVVMLPADRGVFVFLPLFAILKKMYKTRLHYSVIGGWLFERLTKSPLLLKSLRSFTTIQVETDYNKSELERLKVKGVCVVPNFKTINALTKEEAQKISADYPLPLCIFSRVMKEKGIEDAIEVVSKINASSSEPRYTLDIYGAVDSGYKERFEELLQTVPKEISYKGVVESSESVEILKNYYLLLFPTRYATEGLPGTIIDGYAAGLPVLSARWKSFSDIVSEGGTGYGFKLGDNQDFYETLSRLEDVNLVNPLRVNCIEAFSPYSYSQGCLRLRMCIEGEE